MKEIIKKVIQSDRLNSWYQRATASLCRRIEKIKENGSDKETLKLLIQLATLLGANNEKWLAISNSLRHDLTALGLARRRKDMIDLPTAFAHLTQQEEKDDQ